MKLPTPFLLFFTALVSSSAFIVTKPLVSSKCHSLLQQHQRRSRRTFGYPSSLQSASMEASNSNGDETSSSKTVPDADTITEQNELWLEHLESREVQDVREEMIQKYMSFGRSKEFAEAEVDKFLSDPEQSRQFLDMRRYAQAQNDELGFETFLQYGAFLLLGFGGQVAFKYFNAYGGFFPDGGGQ